MASVCSDKAEAADILALAFKQAHSVVALTGAGISTESGLPDFRSPGGIWAQFQPVTYQDFMTSEAARLEDWRRRFIMNAEFARAEPNAAHRALARLAREDRLDLLVTQNVDALHRRAGTPSDRLIEIHGTATHGHCLECHSVMSIAAAQSVIEVTGKAPRCAACGGLIKAAVVSFGEAMPQTLIERAAKRFSTADLVIVIGTALEVHPAASLPSIALRSGAKLLLINTTPTPLDDAASWLVRVPAAQAMHALFEAGPCDQGG